MVVPSNFSGWCLQRVGFGRLHGSCGARSLVQVITPFYPGRSVEMNFCAIPAHVPHPFTPFGAGPPTSAELVWREKALARRNRHFFGS